MRLSLSGLRAAIEQLPSIDAFPDAPVVGGHGVYLARYVKLSEVLALIPEEEETPTCPQCAEALRVLNPASPQETVVGAIRNLQQALLSEQGNVQTLEQKLAADPPEAPTTTKEDQEPQSVSRVPVRPAVGPQDLRVNRNEVNVKRIYVASSWRNAFQPLVCAELREDGHEVYDFRHPAPGNNGFSWSAIDPEWHTTTEPARYLELLAHPIADHGFALDMNALMAADICVMVMPCGMSASLEAGYAKGAGKPLAVYVPGLREPDLMVKMADLVTADLVEVCNWVRAQA